MATRAKELSDLGNLKLDVTANGIDVVGVGSNFKSESYNILNLQTDTNDNGSSDDGIFKITNGSAGTTKGEFRWDESEDLVHVSYGDHGRHISIGSDGKVGINTGSTSPTETLDVAGTALVENAKLKAIAASNSDTAVDVFVYDTSKDSDGGAWRKRTQHTSWYNEAASATRSSRKEFPSVAVIVAESDTVTIYDGDDPAMPMWMVFNQAGAIGSASNIITANSSVTSIDCINGTMCFGMNDSSTPEGTFTVNFISELSRCYRTAGSGYTGSVYTGPVSTRNNNRSYEVDNDTLAIVSQNINDVAMTVLPNAPIDAITGLPVPTIAAATDGGVSVIKDNGTVADITSTSSTYNYWDKAKFTKNNKLIIQANYQNVANQLTHIVDVPTGDVDANNVNAIYSALNGRYYHGDSCSPRLSTSSFKPYVEPMQTDSIAVGHRQDHFGGINLIAEEPSTQSGTTSDSAMCYISSSHNTGWAVGDTKVATLSSTDTTNISASGNTNLLSGGWTNNSSFPYETFTQSGLDITSAINTTAYGALNKTWTATLGKTYTAYFNLTLNSGTAPRLFVQTTSSFGNGIEYQTVNGVNSFTFTATMSSSSYFTFATNNGDATNFSVTNLELYEGGEANHMANPLVANSRTGFSVFGDITKTAVATGAELVAYSGFNSSNYLEQSYNSDLDFNSGDVAYCFWSNNPHTTSEYIADRSEGNGNYRTALYLSNNNGGSMNFYTRDTAATEVTGIIGTPNQWAQIWCIRRGTSHEIWVNGVNKVATVGTVRDVSAASGEAVQKIGVRYNNTTHNTGKIALFRVSATAPTEEQIKKIYNDEKHLFRENAKATLYGTANTVTGLAYDDDTELLHVGTSEGRSVFQGLTRIDNTTDAVGTVISASNGMVAED